MEVEIKLFKGYGKFRNLNNLKFDKFVVYEIYMKRFNRTLYKLIKVFKFKGIKLSFLFHIIHKEKCQTQKGRDVFKFLFIY